LLVEHVHRLAAVDEVLEVIALGDDRNRSSPLSGWPPEGRSI